MVREDRAIFDMGDVADFLPQNTMPHFPRNEDRRRNDLTALQRMALIVAMAALVAILLMAVRPLADGFSTLADFVMSTKHP